MFSSYYSSLNAPRDQHFLYVISREDITTERGEEDITTERGEEDITTERGEESFMTVEATGPEMVMSYLAVLNFSGQIPVLNFWLFKSVRLYVAKV